MTLSIDFETRSPLDLRRTGVYPYAADPDTDIWCMAYAFGDEEPRLWVPGGTVEPRITRHILGGHDVRAWNAQFERIMWNLVLVPRYGFPPLRRAQVYDTAVDAAALGLPRGLGNASSVLGLSEQKDDGGHRLMMRMARPRRIEDDGTIVWWDSRDLRERLYEYCRQDVRTEQAIHQAVRPLGEYERRVYLLDQEVNDRGVRLDLPLIRGAQTIVAVGLQRANRELASLTGGIKVTQTGKLTEWLQARAAVPNIRKDTIRDILAGDTPLTADVRRVLEIRAATAKSSTAKLTTMTEYACHDSRARGMLVYHAAHTGRWAGRGPQPQNYPRPLLDVARYRHHVARGDYDAIAADAPPLTVVSSMLRSMLVAAPGHRLIAGDYGQIEARVLAWLAGQADLTESFASGGKIYETMAAHIYGVPVEDIASEERQVGKGTVLGCGYQMGPNTYARQAKAQTGLIIDRGERADHAVCRHCDVVWAVRAIDCRVCGRPTTLTTHEIRPDMAVAAVRGYRELYPQIPEFWAATHAAALEAVGTGHTTVVGEGAEIRFAVRGRYLWLILPSGRPLAYAMPDIRDHTVTPEEGEPFTVTSVAHCHVDPKTKQWRRRHTYGGLWVENIVQAVARDLMASAMLRLRDAGYPLVMTVHDELVAEVPEGHGSLEEFTRLMAVCPQWAAGLPVAVDGWEGESYRK